MKPVSLGRVSNQVQIHVPANYHKRWLEDLGIRDCKNCVDINKGTDQLCSHHAADQHLCFPI